jgi:hypothetical protein
MPSRIEIATAIVPRRPSQPSAAPVRSAIPESKLMRCGITAALAVVEAVA